MPSALERERVNTWDSDRASTNCKHKQVRYNDQWGVGTQHTHREPYPRSRAHKDKGVATLFWNHSGVRTTNLHSGQGMGGSRDGPAASQGS